MVLGTGWICLAAVVGRRRTAQGWARGPGCGRRSWRRRQRALINVIAIIVVWRRQESRPCVVASILHRIDDQVAVPQSIIRATRDLVLVRSAFRKATPDGIVPSVHVLGEALLVVEEVTANFIRITKEVRRGPAILLGHRGTCIGVPERIPVTVTRCGGRIKPKLGSISIRLVQVPLV